MALYASLPGVADAGQRVSALLGHRERVAGSALPRRVSEALVAVEDERYWHHGAVDPVAVGGMDTAAWRMPAADTSRPPPSG
jgi:membrane peptidoglycan carboxypeptidase